MFNLHLYCKYDLKKVHTFEENIEGKLTYLHIDNGTRNNICFIFSNPDAAKKMEEALNEEIRFNTQLAQSE
jgi:hypothetical protein